MAYINRNLYGLLHENDKNGQKRLVKIGEGGEGSIFVGKFGKPCKLVRNKSEVIIKAFEKTDDKMTSCELDEKIICEKISHKNIIQFFGWSNDLTDRGRTYVTLIFEKGLCDLQYFCAKKISWPIPLNFYLDIANGLYYLHYDLAKTIVHRDIKPANFIVFGPEPYIVKISDFGLAEEIEGRYFSIEHNCGTHNYLAYVKICI
jgi:serine/threonine protein kinase